MNGAKWEHGARTEGKTEIGQIYVNDNTAAAFKKRNTHNVFCLAAAVST